jgi:hypothetical protein
VDLERAFVLQGLLQDVNVFQAGSLITAALRLRFVAERAALCEGDAEARSCYLSRQKEEIEKLVG